MSDSEQPKPKKPRKKPTRLVNLNTMTSVPKHTKSKLHSWLEQQWPVDKIREEYEKVFSIKLARNTAYEYAKRYRAMQDEAMRLAMSNNAAKQLEFDIQAANTQKHEWYTRFLECATNGDLKGMDICSKNLDRLSSRAYESNHMRQQLEDEKSDKGGHTMNQIEKLFESFQTRQMTPDEVIDKANSIFSAKVIDAEFSIEDDDEEDDEGGE